MHDPGTIVGLLIRVAPGQLEAVAAELDGLPGISTFRLDAPGSLGAWLEAADLDEAHARLRRDVASVPGVRAAWPIDVRLPSPHAS